MTYDGEALRAAADAIKNRGETGPDQGAESGGTQPADERVQVHVHLPEDFGKSPDPPVVNVHMPREPTPEIFTPRRRWLRNTVVTALFLGAGVTIWWQVDSHRDGDGSTTDSTEEDDASGIRSIESEEESNKAQGLVAGADISLESTPGSYVVSGRAVELDMLEDGSFTDRFTSMQLEWRVDGDPVPSTDEATGQPVLSAYVILSGISGAGKDNYGGPYGDYQLQERLNRNDLKYEELAKFADEYIFGNITQNMAVTFTNEAGELFLIKNPRFIEPETDLTTTTEPSEDSKEESETTEPAEDSTGVIGLSSDVGDSQEFVEAVFIGGGYG